MLLHGDSLTVLKDFEDNSIDSVVTDPPYGISFMGKQWDKALPSVEIWKQCYRVLKDKTFSFVMCLPRQDMLSRMIINLEDAGFNTNYTSLYWTYASGFPKAANVSKLIDKKYKKRTEYDELAEYLKQSRESKNISIKQLAELFPSKSGGITGCVWNWENAQNVPTESQYSILKEKLGLDNRFDWLIEQETKRYEEAKREIIGKGKPHVSATGGDWKRRGLKMDYYITKPATQEAKKWEGAYVGFQPKPAVEVVLVVSKGKGVTWLDDCRIPYQSEDDKSSSKVGFKYEQYFEGEHMNRNQTIAQKGRFPANLLVSDDVLNDGVKHQATLRPNISEKIYPHKGHIYGEYGPVKGRSGYPDSGSYSRYFDLDKWYSTLPFIICAKASKSEKNKGCEGLPSKFSRTMGDGIGEREHNENEPTAYVKNHHPTVKPIKLMSYLITLGTREGQTVLDPFCGSGTTLIAAEQLNRKWIGIELNEEYIKIANSRLKPYQEQMKIT